jgi:hypothetical protein
LIPRNDRGKKLLKNLEIISVPTKNNPTEVNQRLMVTKYEYSTRARKDVFFRNNNVAKDAHAVKGPCKQKKQATVEEN